MQSWVDMDGTQRQNREDIQTCKGLDQIFQKLRKPLNRYLMHGKTKWVHERPLGLFKPPLMLVACTQYAPLQSSFGACRGIGKGSCDCRNGSTFRLDFLI